MNQFTNPLDHIKIASPCSADWDSMIGNNRQRYCGECKLNVYNLSGMTRDEAENLILQSEGRVCVRYFRRGDGTILTVDCPVGWQAAKKRMSRFWTAGVSLVFTIFAGIGLTSYFSSKEQPEKLMGEIEVSINKNVQTQEELPVLMGAVIYEHDEQIKGKVSNFNDVRKQVIRKYGQ